MKQNSDIFSFINKLFSKEYYTAYITFLLAFVSLCLFSFFAWFLLDLKYFPAHEDETIYYKIADLFSKTQSVVAPTFFDDKVSIIFQANWYGIFYNLFYGSIAYLFGFNSTYFIFVNLICLAVSIFILNKINTSRFQKINMIVFLLMFNMVFTYTFTYFPELLNVLLGTVLSFFIIRMYEHRDSEKLSASIRIYVILCFLFCFVRLTWIFWLLAILPYAKNKKDFSIKIALVFVLTALAFLYSKYFCAPAFVGLGREVTNLTTGSNIINLLVNSFMQFFQNLTKLVFSFKSYGIRAPLIWNISKYITLIAMAYYLYLLVKSKNKLIASGLLVSAFTYAIMLVMYVPEYPYFMKITTSVFILNFIIAVYLNEIKLKWFYLISLGICFPLTIYTSYNTVKERKKSYTDMVGRYNAEVQEIKSIINFIDPKKKISTVQLSPNTFFTDKFPAAIFYAALPVAGTGNNPIRYSLSMESRAGYNEQKFPVYANLKMDYILSKSPINNRFDIKLLHTNNLFYFYEITSSIK